MEIPERKRAMLDAGRELFLTQGYAQTAVDEICAAADVTKGAFFHYFTSKEEFARQLLADTWAEFEAAHGESGAADPAAALHAHVEFMVTFIAGSGRLVPRLAGELAATNPAVRTQVQGYFARWTEELSARLEAAGYGEQVPSMMQFIIAAIEGVPAAAGQLGATVAISTAEHLRRYIDSSLQHA